MSETEETSGSKRKARMEAEESETSNNTDTRIVNGNKRRLLVTPATLSIENSANVETAIETVRQRQELRLRELTNNLYRWEEKGISQL